ncbi:MAG: endonuclease V [Planctomycetes bacterium]|nr:endonuclease V [Planctomycetota bacterium]
MRFRSLHNWDLSYHEAVAVQKRLHAMLRTDVPLDVSRLRTVAGADVAYETKRRRVRGRPADEPVARFVAAVVVMRFPSLEIIETACAAAETSFPYIPGLLSFREGPALQQAFEKLATRPDAIIFDGQGMAHPRGLGLASHVGLLLGAATVGCAKSRLYGVTRGEPGPRRGNRRALLAPEPSGEVFAPGSRIGTLLRTRDGVKPVWVSVGHNIDLPNAEQLVLRTTRGRRLCEPIRAAHRLVNDALRRATREGDSAKR